ncbi:hypothetical protein [Chitinophaga nivalis]|uniref:Uncharacterized protein n=1 Tax=Chitinophaga nivalis TaxID=2991709 RepID=A0ABT3IP42_9BACT|nr:hypothetical protein [Chitinophaga nivalis]MCW3464564.1 hypothetical protein [Chitinophaga nivalis]MCW3485745.1 hypothetical protein [Chitinophaga nivalis]
MATNKDTVQQYIDRLLQEYTEAARELTNAKAEELKKQGELDKNKKWAGVLSNMFSLISETNRLGVIYMGTLERTRKQNEKLGHNASLSVDAIKILLCETRKVLDCTEVFKGLIKTLSDRIDCKIPSKGTNSIMAVLAALKTAVEEALTAVKEVVNALLAVYHLEEELLEQIAGERGLLYQVTGMYILLTDGVKPDLEACASCHPRKKPIFPMDANTCDFYTHTKEEYERVIALLKEIQRELDLASCRREFAQAKNDALKNAYDAAIAAKSCDTKK